MPGIHAARVEREGHGRAERPGRVLAPVIVGHRMAGLDGAGRRRVGRLQAGNDFAGGEDLDR